MKHILTVIIGFSIGVYLGIQVSNVVRFINTEAAPHSKNDTGLTNPDPDVFDFVTF